MAGNHLKSCNWKEKQNERTSFKMISKIKTSQPRKNRMNQKSKVGKLRRTTSAGLTASIEAARLGTDTRSYDGCSTWGPGGSGARLPEQVATAPGLKTPGLSRLWVIYVCCFSLFFRLFQGYFPVRPSRGKKRKGVSGGSNA